MSVLVVGDVMVDCYWSGPVDRLSPEAPVPVVLVDHEEHRAGAAANVAANCAALGAQTTLIGIVGRDESAETLYDLSIQAGVNTILLPDRMIRTTQKLRVIGRGQQIVRLDREMVPVETLELVALRYIENHDVIVFSDYGKGALTCISKLIKAAKAMHKTVLVDPKGHDYSKYAGADVLKLNKDELRDMVGGWGTTEQQAAKAHAIRKDADIGTILVTLAAEGMVLYDSSGEKRIASKACEVFDVTGAGDTVIAAMAVMMDDGMPIPVAARIANHAAGIAVGKSGTAVVSAKELEEVMRETIES